uniref:Uncharacterized protein n=1 Tax=Leersia perrieri TaxID=77586 RepID=A0A0D9WCK7_9ORYZ
MTAATFAVRRRKPELIGPSIPTPRETKRLSDIDDQDALRVQVPFVFFYHAGGDDDPVHVIRRAIAAALVPYYPLAGRLREIDDRKLVVDCTGEGILFVEADADVRMDELEEEDDVMAPPFPYLEQLLFDVEGSAPGVVNSPLMLVQVTRLLCGGFVLAVRINHAMCDAIGFAQFLLAVADIARGLPAAVAPPPPWQRELLDARIPPAPSFPHREFDAVSPPPPTPTPCDVIVTRTFTFAPTDIAKIKNRLRETPATAFEAVTAFLWRARTAALEIAGDETVRLVIIANVRGVAGLNLPAGYYGNACVSPTAITTAGELLHLGEAAAVEMVKEAKKSVTAEYARSTADVLVSRGRPMMATANVFAVSDQRHAGFDRLDFGWGSPVYGGAAETVFGLSLLVAVKDAVGVMVSLPPPAMERFASEMETMMINK